MEFLKNSHLDNIISINRGPRGSLSLSAKELVVEVYIKENVVVSNMLLHHFWEAPY